MNKSFTFNYTRPEDRKTLLKLSVGVENILYGDATEYKFSSWIYKLGGMFIKVIKHSNPQERVEKLKHFHALLSQNRHFVPLIDAVVVEENAYALIYPFVEQCSSLENVIAKPLYKVRNFMRQIIEAVTEIHKNGFVHRDLQMNNFMVSRETLHVFLVGTNLVDTFPAGNDNILNLRNTFCAPELILNTFLGSKSSANSPSSDIWEIGVIAYKLIYRENIWHNRADLISDNWRFPNHVVQTTEEYRDFVRKCLQSDVQQRMTTLEIQFHDWIL